MGIAASGRARFESDIQDLSILVATGLKGIAAVAGVTSWGELGASQLVGNWTEFQKYFGGLRTDNDFPAYCKFMLDRGAKLRVGRVAHFTDVSDISTVTATKGTITTTTTAAAETRATSTATVTTIGATNDVFTYATGGYSWSYTQLASSSPTICAAGVAAAINVSTSVHGYSATSSVGVVTISAPAGTGATANGQVATFTKTGGTGAISKTNFASGVTEKLYTGAIKFDGAYATDALNGSTVTVTAAANGVAGEIDMTISIAGMPFLATTVKNLPRVFTSDAKNKFNLQSQHIKIDTYSGSIENGVSTLASGTLVLGALDDNDYIGDETALTGIHSFDNDTDFVRLAVPEKATMAVDNAIMLYVATRKDCRAILRTPMGISGTTGVQYRSKTGSYSGGTEVNDWRGSMVFGDITVTHPSTGLDFDIPAVCGALVAAAFKDNKAYAWFAAGGPKRGRISSVVGVPYNLASPARSTEFDSVDLNGLNAVVKDPEYGVVYWGNGTLQRADTMLKHENVADLMIFLTRSLAPVVKIELFDPNDVQTWKAIYRKVKVLMDYVQKNRGVWKWKYDGDQDIDDVANAVINSSNDIDAGAYNFVLWVAPKVGMKYVGMKVAVTNSNVSFEMLADQIV